MLTTIKNTLSSTHSQYKQENTTMSSSAILMPLKITLEDLTVLQVNLLVEETAKLLDISLALKPAVSTDGYTYTVSISLPISRQAALTLISVAYDLINGPLELFESYGRMDVVNPLLSELARSTLMEGKDSAGQ